MLLLALVAISLIKASQCVKAIPGQPVPNADVLGDLLSKFLGDSYSNNALFDFILGKPNQNRDNLKGDNLDISILDVNNVRKIIAFAKKKYENAMNVDGIMAPQNTRRLALPFWWWWWWWEPNPIPDDSPYYLQEYVANKSLELMSQTMYMTKEKINLTRPFRKRYMSEAGYQIAILYGASASILVKMEALYSQMQNFWGKTHFIWYLIIYEKLISCSVDINDSIEKIFIVQHTYAQLRGAKDETNSIQAKGGLSRAQVKEMLLNPSKAHEFKSIVLQHQKRFQRK